MHAPLPLGRFRPPICRITRSPSTSGAAAMPQIGISILYSVAMSFSQWTRPPAASRQTRWPVAPSEYARPRSTVTDARGPLG